MGLQTIVVSIAGSPASLITAKYAIAIAKLLSVKLIALFVVDKKSAGPFKKPHSSSISSQGV